jgi:SOS-response transcriptional repressor LexA
MTKGKFPNGLASLINNRRGMQSALAEHLGVPRQNVGRWVKGERKVPIELADDIATFFKVTRDDVLFEDGSQVMTVPLISWVSAGEFGEIIASDGIQDVPHVATFGLPPNGEWVAFTVEGDSMDRISPPESIIFVDMRDKALVPNACYIVSDDEGALTYKRYRPDPDRFEPVSVNSEYEPIFVSSGSEPVIIGRVRRSLLSM